MSGGQDTIWDKFLKPIFAMFLDKEQMVRIKNSIDWEAERERLSQPELIYPEYYLGENFHGIKGRYLNIEAAITYDPITQYVLLPNEDWIRQGVIDSIKGYPNSILDLGCGTGSTTLMLKKAFPRAQVTGIDLSPYMLALANYKSEKAGLQINWRHGKAEATGLRPACFDLVTASLLLHETPPIISQSILQECFRILVPGGQVIILDGNQKTLRQTQWLTDIFEEPYIKTYAHESVEAWMGLAGFVAVQTQDLWWTNQVTKGIKPLPVQDTQDTFYRQAQQVEMIGVVPAV